MQEPMTTGMETDADPNASEEPTALYEHVKCKDWGLAILAWERDGRRAYQFEDGKLRVFKDGYYDLLREVDRPADEMRALFDELSKKLGRSQQRRKAAEKGETMLTFDQQVKVFRAMHPQGFEDPAWISKVRGEGVERRLKRHRTPAIEEARRRLSVEALDEQIDGERFTETHQGVVEMLQGTNLVTPRQLEPLQRLDAERHGGFAIALRDLLHGEGSHSIRFERYCSAMRSLGSAKSPGWQLVTSIPALARPEDHICIRPSMFREQARWMAPRLEHQSRPNAEIYERYLTMASTVRERLEEAGLKPRDLMDVHDFMWETLRPSAKKKLDALDGDSSGESTGSGASASEPAATIH